MIQWLVVPRPGTIARPPAAGQPYPAAYAHDRARSNSTADRASALLHLQDHTAPPGSRFDIAVRLGSLLQREESVDNWSEAALLGQLRQVPEILLPLLCHGTDHLAAASAWLRAAGLRATVPPSGMQRYSAFAPIRIPR